MLAANETVAEDYFWQSLPFLYRTHDNPDPEKMKQLGTFIAQGYVHLLRLQERELFADSLAAYARKVSDADVQSVRATMDGIVNGTTTL